MFLSWLSQVELTNLTPNKWSYGLDYDDDNDGQSGKQLRHGVIALVCWAPSLSLSLSQINELKGF